jgi:tetratricopeptide (TPR) repeat protein
MPIDPRELRTGGALQGAVAASLLRAREAASELAPGARVGIYRVLRELGRGGMAIVYLAARDDGEYEQQVALKWMQAAHAGDGSEALFRRERQALADLRHPHIARLLDGGRGADGRPWFAMEYIEGERIDRHCARQALPLARRLALFREVCAAVAFAHARGVIHRDIKPSNVLVDSDGSARLLDFGIAQLLGEDDALASRAYTPGFASPEQVRGETLTIASDVYQLGRLLAAMLGASSVAADSAATRGGDAATVAVEIDPAPAHGVESAPALPAGLAPDLVAIVSKATATDPAQRYATADALAGDVAALLERRPVSARNRTTSYVARRYMQRHPVGVAAALLALALLTAMALAFTTRLRQERDLAQQQRDIAQQERDAAEQARAASDAINRFLNEDLLDAANPLKRAPGAPEVTVRQALDQAEPRVAQRFANEPAVQASVLTTLGVLRYEFGEYERAMQLYDQALGAAGPLPETHPERMRAHAEKGALLITNQDFAAGIAEFGPLVETGTRLHGTADARVLEWRLRLHEAQSRQGADLAYVDEFETLAQEADVALGKPNAIAGEARLFIAHAHRMKGAPDAGAPAAAQAHADLAATIGEDHPSTLKALTVLAHGLQAQGRNDEAIDAARRAYELQKARYGQGTVDTLFLQNEYGFLLSAVERFAEAEQVFADLVVQRAALWGERSIQVVPPLSNLGHARMRQGRVVEALADFERAVAVMDSLEQAPATIRAIVLRGKADALRELGRYREAGATLDAADEVALALAENDLRRYALLGSRARLLIASGERERGIAMLDAAIAAMRAQVKDVNPMLKPLLAARAALGPSP